MSGHLLLLPLTISPPKPAPSFPATTFASVIYPRDDTAVVQPQASTKTPPLEEGLKPATACCAAVPAENAEEAQMPNGRLADIIPI